MFYLSYFKKNKNKNKNNNNNYNDIKFVRLVVNYVLIQILVLNVKMVLL